MKQYRLGSSPLVHAPGIIAWAMNGYAFEDDRPQLERVVSETWKIPPQAAKALLSKEVSHQIEGDVVLFEVAA